MTLHVPGVAGLAPGESYVGALEYGCNRGARKQWLVGTSLFADGHTEAYARPLWVYTEPPEIPEGGYPPDDRERGMGDPEATRIRSLRRRKAAIRHAVHGAEFNRLMTFSTQDLITDRALFGGMVVQCIKLVEAALGRKVHYVLVLEKQKRGAWHAHVALRGRLEWKLWQTIWQYRCCGGRKAAVYDNVRKWNKLGAIKRLTLMASYMCKYMGKDLSEVEFNKKAYWISKNIPAPIRTSVVVVSHDEAASLLSMLSAQTTRRLGYKPTLWVTAEFIWMSS